MPENNESRKEIEARLKALNVQQEERLAHHRAQLLHLPYINLLAFPVDATVLSLIPREKAKEVGAVLFYKRGRDVRLGVVNPANNEQLNEAKREVTGKLGMKPQVYVISRHSLEVALSRYASGDLDAGLARDEMLVSQKRLEGFEETIDSLQELGKRITSVGPSEILSTIVAGAIKMRASDVHIEPRREEARLRYRIDGVLQDITSFDLEGWRQILSRVKVLSSLKLNVRDVPQDGSFVLRVDGDAYDVRVSVLPGAVGENIVLRLFSRQDEDSFKLSKLGMKERDYKLVLEELKQSTGMVVAAGPTGSGKTTTIVACLRYVNRPELKIITLEDPIEYRLAGIEQTEVDHDAGYTFAIGLRSIVRQDPDIIFVGEMRDVETAETSVHAAMTGHLVFSTIHSNDAAGAVLRIIDTGIKPYVLAPAINLVIAQRLVRKVCQDCAEEYIVTVEQREHIKEVMSGVVSSVFDSMVLDNPKLTFVRGKGCKKCGNTGYTGRMGVFEVFAVKGEIEELILQGADSGKIREAAVRQGMTTIAQDAYLKVIDKVTTVEEVERISEE